MQQDTGDAQHGPIVRAETSAQPPSRWRGVRSVLVMLALYLLSFGLIFAGWGFRDIHRLSAWLSLCVQQQLSS